MALKLGDCVRISDGRTGRVREKKGNLWRVRVRRNTNKTHQFLYCAEKELKKVACPAGWMSPDGYRRYLRKTLVKMRERQQKMS